MPESPGWASRSPALSPDGALVAFVHGDIGPAGDIWIIPVAGGEPRRLTDHTSLAVVAGSPSWTPDGRHILYSAGGFGTQHLWRVDVETGDFAPLTTGTGGYDSPTMSGGNGIMVYTNRRSMWRLIRTDTATGAHTTIYESRNPILVPELSPNGDSIAFFGQIATGLHVFSIGVDGQDLRQLTFDDRGQNLLPVWSENGDWIYYYRSDALHRIPSAGGPSVEVLPDFHWSSRDFLMVRGNRIAYRESRIEPGVERVVIKDLESGTERELSSAMGEMDWARDGNEIVGRQRDFDILICEIETLECRTILGGGALLGGEQPRWSADMSRIFFQRGSFESALYRTLWVVNRDGQGLSELVMYGPVSVDTRINIGRNDDLIWNQVDRGNEEIWVARVSGP